MRIGFGYDVHPLVEGRELWLGGVRIEYPYGLMGHSDADVVIHAICDALLGAANLGDIGLLFPDTEELFKGIDSKYLLRDVMLFIQVAGFRLGNIDVTVVAEQPKLSPYIPEMKKTLAEQMCVSVDDISIKATTTEKLGFTGRSEGIAAYAVALLKK